MAASTLNPHPTRDSKDMGIRLLAAERRQRQLHDLKIAGVWLALLVLLVLGLLQLRFDPSYIWQNSGFVFIGLGTTLAISLVSILVATLLSLVGALARISSNPIAQAISGFYVSLFRGTPLLIQIYIIYLGLPQIGQTLKEVGYPTLGSWLILNATASGVIALSLNYGAYMTEIFRAGIQAVGIGQWQASAALGMTHRQTLWHVILPQALRTVFPAIVNQFIAMQKDSSLVSIMGLWEITYRANRFARKDGMFMEMFLLAAAIYWILTIVSEWGQRHIEQRLAQGDHR